MGGRFVGWVVGWSNLILDPTLALIRAQLGFRIQVGAECGNKTYQTKLNKTKQLSKIQENIWSKYFWARNNMGPKNFESEKNLIPKKFKS